ncbi:hypothetical protein ACOMHN_040664 [Nucella lapillus]
MDLTQFSDNASLQRLLTLTITCTSDAAVANNVAASPAPPPLPHFPPCSPPRSNTPESMLDMEDDPEKTAEGSILAALSRSLSPSVHEEGVLGEVEEQEPIPEESQPSTGTARGGVAKVEESSVESKTVSSGISDPALPAAPAPVHVIQAINIPTGGEMEEEEEVGEALKGDRGAGDQVDQVAHLLVKAVLPAEHDESSSSHVRKVSGDTCMRFFR